MLQLVRVGECKRCGKCCNINNLPEGCSIGSVREDGTCTYHHVIDGVSTCLKQVTVSGKPLYCQQFPTKPEDIAKIPDCGYSFKEIKQDE